MTSTRGDMLADLADAINELTEIRHHVEVFESETQDGNKRRRVRRRHIQTVPSLLDALADAMLPATTGDSGSAGFESRPSAELEPINVMATITDESGTYARALGIDKNTLKGRLHALVGASHTDTQLRNLVYDAKGWVRRARLATGWEAASFTLNSPCPYCWRKHVLTITGDLEMARCTKCGAEWDEMTIGLLGQMLTVNEEAETWAAARCESLHHGRYCQRADGHGYEHRDHQGHYWYNGPDGGTYVETGQCA